MTTVVVPFFGDDPQRRRNLDLVTQFYARAFPGWQLIVSGGVSRGDAINRALPGCDEIVIMNDADSLPSCPAAVTEAVTMLMSDHDFVRCFTAYRKLFKLQTVQHSDPFLILHRPAVEFDLGVSRSHGIAATLRGVMEECGGYDPRFHGWGYEDLALDELLLSRYNVGRVSEPLYHLWHEPDPSGAEGSATLLANELLHMRYLQHAGCWRELRALRAEAGELAGAPA